VVARRTLPGIGGALALALFLSAPARSESKPIAEVDWENQVLKAIGSGAPNVQGVNSAQARLGADKAARADAFRNLLAQAKTIRVSGDETVGDAMAKEQTKAKVESALRAYRVVAKRFYSDGGIEMDVEVPLSALADAVVEPAPARQAPDRFQNAAAQDKSRKSGLVVDARGLKVTPALAPRLLDESGAEVFGIDFLSAEARKLVSVAAYVPILAQGKKLGRVGKQPLVVKALDARGTDLVLSSDQIRQLDAAVCGNLSEGGVAILATVPAQRTLAE
jgi:hypothetical protein